jgi:hypothetical protein
MQTPEEIAAAESASKRFAEECREWEESVRAKLASLPVPAQITQVMMWAAQTGYPSDEEVIVDEYLIQRLLPDLVGDDFDAVDPCWDDAEIAY